MSPIAAGLARLDQDGRRLYTWTGAGKVEEFYSVTTLLGIGIPKYLVPWASKIVAELAYDGVAQTVGTKGRRRGAGVLRVWAREGAEIVRQARLGGAKLAKIDETPRGLALRYLKSEPDRVRDAAADIGIKVHAAAEDVVVANMIEASRLILDGAKLPAWPDTIKPWMDGFTLWLRRYRVEFMAAEATVFNRSQVYAGTGDAWARVWTDLHDDRGTRWIPAMIDYKSGKSTWPEVALQCCAYARGEFIGGADLVTEHDVPEAEVTAVLHLTPKGPTFTRLRYDDAMWTMFLYTREIFRWVVDMSSSAFIGEIEPNVEDALEASLAAIASGS